MGKEPKALNVKSGPMLLRTGRRCESSIMKGIVYILKSLKNNRFYIGSTNDLRRRLREHQQGKNKYTKNILPMKPIFTQTYPTLRTARKIEYRLKKLKRKDIIEKIIKENKIRLDS